MNANTPQLTAWAPAGRVQPCLCTSSGRARPAVLPRRRFAAFQCSQQGVRRQKPGAYQQQRNERAQAQEFVLRPLTNFKQQRRQQHLQWKLLAPRREVREISRDGRVPAEAVWMQELLPFRNVMNDANRPWARPLVLEMCYVRNDPEARGMTAALSPIELDKLLNLRYYIERGTSSAMHALQQLQHRLTLLECFVLDEGGVLTEQQIYKERDDLGQARLGIKHTQAALTQALAKARALKDEHYRQFGSNLGTLLDGLSTYAIESVKPQLNALIAYSELQRRAAPSQGRQKRNKAAPERPAELPCSPQDLRRMGQQNQQDLMDLLAEYRSQALKFDGYQDSAVLSRPTRTGQPTAISERFNRVLQPQTEASQGPQTETRQGQHSAYTSCNGAVAAGDNGLASGSGAHLHKASMPHRLRLAPAWRQLDDAPLRGKPLPPMAVLWQRALRVEAAELVGNQQRQGQERI